MLLIMPYDQLRVSVVDQDSVVLIPIFNVMFLVPFRNKMSVLSQCFPRPNNRHKGCSYLNERLIPTQQKENLRCQIT